MEIAILAGLSFLGYQLSKRPDKSVPNPQVVHSMHLPDSNHDIPRHNDNFSHSNMVPFYRSEKTQNTRDDVKDRKLATFTGTDNIEYKKKVETFQPEPTKEITNIHGVTFQPDIHRYMDYAASSKHNNVSPVEKQYVGPGLGSVNDTNPGFHDTFRVLPDNINVYRKNNLQGSMNHGKSGVDNRAFLPGDATSTTRKAQTDHSSYVSGPMSTVHGMTQRPKFTTSSSQEPYVCEPPAGLVSQTMAPMNVGQQMHSRPMRTNPNCMVMGNPALLRAHAPDAQFLVHANERDNPNCHVLNSQLSTASVGRRFEHHDVSTLRDMNNCHRLNVASNTHMVQSHQINTAPTQRGGCEQQMIANPSYSNGHMSTAIRTDTHTLRDTSNCYTSQPHFNGGMDYGNAYAADTNSSREFVVMTERTPNAGRTNIHLDKSQLHMSVKENVGESTSHLVGGVFGKGIQNFTSNNGQTISTTKTTDPTNNRQFGFAPGNPLAIRINH